MSGLTKTALKAAIDAQITTNGTNSITGAQLNAILEDMVDSYEDTIPQLTEAQIAALTPVVNQLVYNTDRNYLMQYNGSIWVTLVAMLIGTTAEIAASTPKEGQLFYDTDMGLLSFGDGVTHSGLQTTSCVCIKTEKISLSSAQILNSNTSPVELIPAPGAGKVISVSEVIIVYPNGTTVYATNTTASITYSVISAAGNILSESIDLTDNFGNKIKLIPKVSTVLSDNQSIKFGTVGGDPTDGNGTIDLYITYQIIDL